MCEILLQRVLYEWKWGNICTSFHFLGVLIWSLHWVIVPSLPGRHLDYDGFWIHCEKHRGGYPFLYYCHCCGFHCKAICASGNRLFCCHVHASGCSNHSIHGTNAYTVSLNGQGGHEGCNEGLVQEESVQSKFNELKVTSRYCLCMLFTEEPNGRDKSEGFNEREAQEESVQSKFRGTHGVCCL